MIKLLYWSSGHMVKIKNYITRKWFEYRIWKNGGPYLGKYKVKCVREPDAKRRISVVKNEE